MRFLHTADWHIGKKLNGYDLFADQKYILNQLLTLAKKEAVDAIVIAGDLYDRSVPSVEAVEIFNQTIIEMNLDNQFPILAISGNHDSSIRLEAGSPWFAKTNFYLHTRLSQAFQPIEMQNVQFFLLPYFEPFEARLYFDEDLPTIKAAMQRVVVEMKKAFDPTKKQVLVSHFFVAGSSRTDSETQIEGGGLDGVPADLLADFDYVALGHLHNKDALHSENCQYSGAPLKFSVSEAAQKKGVFLVDTEKNTREFYPLTPLHDLQEITASFKELVTPEYYQTQDRELFLHIQLTDQAIIPNMMNQLRSIYPRILSVERREGIAEKRPTTKFKKRLQSPQQLIDGFFQEMTETKLSETQEAWLAKGLQAVTREMSEDTCSQEN